MSLLDEEEFKLLRNYKGKVDVNLVEKILSEMEDDYKNSKDKDLQLTAIYVFSNYVNYVRQNKEFFDLIVKILQKYVPKHGMEVIIPLIINSLK